MRSRKSPAILAGLTFLLGAATAGALWNLPGHHAAPGERASRDTSPPASTTTTTTAPRPRASLGSDDAPATGAALPPAMQRSVDEDLARLHDAADVTTHLADLQARARRQGRVTAVEVESGVAAIARFLPPDQAASEIARYQQQMLELSRTLDGRRDPPAENLPALASLIAQTSDGTERQNLTRRYLEAVMREPADEQPAALQRLQPTNEGSLRP
jgi:hypothetical protein